MTDAELIDELHYLGIDEGNSRVVALLPLVQVAWADGKLQDAERSAIHKIANEGAFATSDGERVLDGWLSNAPSQAYFQRGHRVIVELARRGGGLESGVTGDTIDVVLGYCETVARAAGGLFGLMFSVDANERRAITEIAVALRITPTDAGWGALAEELD